MSKLQLAAGLSRVELAFPLGLRACDFQEAQSSLDREARVVNMSFVCVYVCVNVHEPVCMCACAFVGARVSWHVFLARERPAFWRISIALGINFKSWPSTVTPLPGRVLCACECARIKSGASAGSAGREQESSEMRARKGLDTGR